MVSEEVESMFGSVNEPLPTMDTIKVHVHDSILYKIVCGRLFS